MNEDVSYGRPSRDFVNVPAGVSSRTTNCGPANRSYGIILRSTFSVRTSKKANRILERRPNIAEGECIATKLQRLPRQRNFQLVATTRVVHVKPFCLLSVPRPNHLERDVRVHAHRFSTNYHIDVGTDTRHRVTLAGNHGDK